SIPMFNLNCWQDSLSFMMLPAVAATVALSVFGSLAIVLAVTGLFGLASYTVSKRMRELGIRVALGAQQVQVLRAALARTVLLLLLWGLSGLLRGFAATRVLACMASHARAADPFALSGVVLGTVVGGR